MFRLDLRACIPWLDRSTGADHRSRAFQITPSVALSLSLSLLLHATAEGVKVLRKQVAFATAFKHCYWMALLTVLD